MDWLKKKVKQKISSYGREGLIQVDPDELRFPDLPNQMMSASSSISEISSYAQEGLIQVNPNKLRFPLLTNPMLSATFSIKVVNVTDNHVAFVTSNISADMANYSTYPQGGILAPRSTQELLVRRTAQKYVAQSIECNDKYVLHSTTVSESFSISQYGSDLYKFYNEQGGQIWCERNLAVVLEQPNSEISSYAREGLIQVNPNKLRFPILPNTTLSASFSIKEAEKHISDMVNSKALIAKIDRPMGIVSFRTAQDSNGVLNSWASNLEKLLDLVEKSCHQIHKETMIHKAVLKA